MEDTNPGYLPRTRKIASYIFVPSPLEVLAYFFAALLVLLLASYRAILAFFAEGVPAAAVDVSSILAERLEYVNVVLDVPILGRIILFMFWLGIGSVVYALVWLFQNLAVEVYDDITLAALKEPQDEDAEDSSYWHSTLAHTLFIGCFAIIFLFFVSFSVNFLLPLWLQLFQTGWYFQHGFRSFLWLMFGVLGMMFTLHLGLLSLKVFARAKSYLKSSF